MVIVDCEPQECSALNERAPALPSMGEGGHEQLPSVILRVGFVLPRRLLRLQLVCRPLYELLLLRGCGLQPAPG